jgi:putative nucleotidyltransferase with HDIG domain
MDMPRLSRRADRLRSIQQTSCSGVARSRLSARLRNGRIPFGRILALLCALGAVPAVFGLAGLWKDTPVRVGEMAPRTVIAPRLTRVPDLAETGLARRQAAAWVEPVLQDDPQARAAIVQSVRDLFTIVKAARQPGPGGQVASAAEQVRVLSQRLDTMPLQGLELLVGLSDAQLEQVRSETIGIAQQLARLRIKPEGVPGQDLRRVIDGPLRTELAVRSFSQNLSEQVVVPIIRSALRPTVVIDEEATAQARRVAAGNVAEVERSFIQGSPIVTAGEIVDEAQMVALQNWGLEGTEPWADLLEAAVLTLVLTFAIGLHLRVYRQDVWRCPRRLLLLALLALLFAMAIQAVSLIGIGGSERLYLIPIGAIAMLVTILFDAPMALLMLLPSVALIAYHAPSQPAVVVFTAIAGLESVPLVSRLSARGHLRQAAWRSTLAYAVIAGGCAAVFDTTEAILPAALAGLVGGMLTALTVNGLLPFLDSTFGILTATSLLDLADRNHPLLRELEQKALGSYNHSILVATMVERACRAIGADSLLGSVGALYHDIGKAQKPQYFVENQFSGTNPHDDLDPAASAVIIQEHVTEGIKMATAHHLPPEVVEYIATHHGTTPVSYFYRKALQSAEDPTLVNEHHYRYKGRKPSSRETAVLMLADCCEGASRAAAQVNGNLDKHTLEDIVTRLVRERVEDNQLDECPLTFADLHAVQQSFVQTLVGIYHLRVTYPDIRATDATVGANAQPKADRPEAAHPLPRFGRSAGA